MVSYSDYGRKSALLLGHEPLSEERPRRRFRLFAALAAPFKDMDDRALHKKRKQVAARNNSKGNMFVNQTAEPVQLPLRRFARSGD
jgi:hypothetical protein